MNTIDPRRIFWHSRRGMLELDLLLVPFAQEVFGTLSNQEQLLYEQFLEEEDQDLFRWLMERMEPPDPAFKPLIEQILAHSKSRT